MPQPRVNRTCNTGIWVNRTTQSPLPGMSPFPQITCIYVNACAGNHFIPPYPDAMTNQIWTYQHLPEYVGDRGDSESGFETL